MQCNSEYQIKKQNRKKVQELAALFNSGKWQKDAGKFMLDIEELIEQPLFDDDALRLYRIRHAIEKAAIKAMTEGEVTLQDVVDEILNDEKKFLNEVDKELHKIHIDMNQYRFAFDKNWELAQIRRMDQNQQIFLALLNELYWQIKHARERGPISEKEAEHVRHMLSKVRQNCWMTDLHRKYHDETEKMLNNDNDNRADQSLPIGPSSFLWEWFKSIWHKVTGGAKNIFARIATALMKIIPTCIKRWIHKLSGLPALAALTKLAKSVFQLPLLAKAAVVGLLLWSAITGVKLYNKLKHRLPRSWQDKLGRVEQIMVGFWLFRKAYPILAAEFAV